MRAGLPLLMGVGVFLAAACAPPVQRSSSESSGGLPASQPKLLHLGSLPAGKMEVIWKLREGVRWHDGTPFEAGDVVLGYKIATDPRLALSTAALRQIEDVTSPDPQTVVVTWRNVFIFANDMGLSTIVP